MRTKALLMSVAAAALAVGLVACSSNGTAGGSGSGTTPASSGGSAASSSAGGSSSSAAGTSSSAGSSAAASGASSSGAAPGGGGKTLPCGPATTLNFQSGGDVNIQNMWQQDLLPVFKKACPNITVNFTFDTHSTNQNLDTAKIAAALKTGKTPDIDVTDDFATQAAQAQLTVAVTPSNVPALANVSQAALKSYNNLAAPYRGSAVLLAYDSTKISSPPKTLADLLTWIKANPGKFTYNDPSTGGSGQYFVESVLESKMSQSDVAKMNAQYEPTMESTWDPGMQVLKSLTPDVYQKVYPKGNQAVLDLMAKNEIEMAPVWSDMFLSAQATNQLSSNWKVTQITQPTFSGGPAYLAIIKNTPHLQAAEAFVNWVLQPAQQTVIVQKIAGFPAIPLSSLPSNVQTDFTGVDTQNLRPAMNSKNQADYQKKWSEVVPG